MKNIYFRKNAIINLYFADPSHKVQGIQVYCSDGYGTMLWNLRSDYCEKYLKFSKHGMYNLHMTDTYLVEHYFAAGQPSLRKQTFRKYSKFVQKLLQFSSKEICFLSKVLLNDPRSTLCKNVWFLNDLTNVNIVRQTNFR